MTRQTDRQTDKSSKKRGWRKKKKKSEGGLERLQWLEFGNEMKSGAESERESERNKREAAIAASRERRRGAGVDSSKETDEAPLTAASSCFLSRAAPLMFVCLSYYLFH